MAELSPRRARFREELRELIQRNTHPWSGTATVYRREVEELGASLWDLRTGSIVQSMISTSADLAEEDPPRRWSAFNDVFLL